MLFIKNSHRAIEHRLFLIFHEFKVNKYAAKSFVFNLLKFKFNKSARMIYISLVVHFHKFIINEKLNITVSSFNILIILYIQGYNNYRRPKFIINIFIN